MGYRSIIAGARNGLYSAETVREAIHQIAQNSVPPLSSLVRRGCRTLVKVNMGCSGARAPEARLTSHPLIVEAIINELQDYGASVAFGDDSARAGKHYDLICRATGMADVAKRTGARLLDFVEAGSREVRGRLLFPQNYLVTNAYFEAEVIVNAASCRSHVGVGLSGAVKNMFGCIIGRRKLLIHNLFPGNPRVFGKVIADIYRTIPAHFSFLDLTSVVEAAGINLAVRPVNLILGGTDAVALDTIASHAIGYDDLPIWTSHFGGKFGIGCNVMEQIEVRGIDWNCFERQSLHHPFIETAKASLYDRTTAVLNNTVLRPRPVVHADQCTACGDCVRRCPVRCIEQVGSTFKIDLGRCADCGCCLKACDIGAITNELGLLARTVRRTLGRSPRSTMPIDPAPMR